MNDIHVKIYQFIEDKLGVNKSAITNSASFYDDLEVDSLDFYELIVEIEDEFRITISDDQYPKIKTIGALVDYIAKNGNNLLVNTGEKHVVSEVG